MYIHRINAGDLDNELKQNNITHNQTDYEQVRETTRDKEIMTQMDNRERNRIFFFKREGEWARGTVSRKFNPTK